MPRHVQSGCAALFLSYLLIAIGSSDSLLAADAKEDFIIVKGHKAHPTRLMAKFKPNVAPGARQTAASAVNVSIREQFNLVPGLVVLDEAGQSSKQAASVQNAPDPKAKAQQLADRIAALKGSGVFEYVEPDYLVYLDATPSDAAFADGTLWGLRNTGQNGGVSGADIGAVSAWNITTGSPSVIVAVIDSGIRYTHRDLAANMWRNPGEIPGNGIDDDGDGYVDNVYGINAITGSGDPMDDNGHGTHVAGTIGAVANDGNTHVGVAWNVKLMACKAGDASGSLKISDQIKCIDFAVTKGVRIANASFGGSSFSQAQFDAISRARLAGMLFVAAAGNEANNNDATPAYPASHSLDNIISVAALDRADQLANFSNYGRTKVHLGAPGVSIFSCGIASDTAYGVKNGTSMATPHVAGVAALILSRYPDISLSQLRNQILNSTVPIVALQNKTTTGGRVNALNALNAFADGNFEIAVTPVADSTLIGGSTVQLSVKVADLADVTNATVSGSIQGASNLVFSTASASNGIYTAGFVVPPFSNALTLTINVAAPGKTTAVLTVNYEVAQFFRF